MKRMCECCGQPLKDVREGVQLSPLKARIFDLIKSRPGITKKELCDAVYDTVSESRIYTMGAHIAQIRDKFEATDITVRGIPFHGYKIGKRKVHVV